MRSVNTFFQIRIPEAERLVTILTVGSLFTKRFAEKWEFIH